MSADAYPGGLPEPPQPREDGLLAVDEDGEAVSGNAAWLALRAGEAGMAGRMPPAVRGRNTPPTRRSASAGSRTWSRAGQSSRGATS